jgi:DNA-binding Lrp family transcriptional regulator
MSVAWPPSEDTLRERVAALSENHQYILRQRLFGRKPKKTFVELASEMGIAPVTVRDRMDRALKHVLCGPLSKRNYLAQVRDSMGISAYESYRLYYLRFEALREILLDLNDEPSTVDGNIKRLERP